MTTTPHCRECGTLTRARDLADSGYTEPLTVADLAAAALLSPAHFSREFQRAFGESPHSYLLTRRLERAASLLRSTDWAVADICMSRGAEQRGVVHLQLHRVVRDEPDRVPRLVPAGGGAGADPGCVAAGLRAAGQAQHESEKTGPGDPA